ncbi:hypothetical protein OJAV_G00192910 [Oryzias javanicus]|uniref:Peroxiredoxin-like 2A n=1 Tax=Oryzias javanicus TaxID=123683 RepID=A0A3S2PFN9_ORYJA|nr:hypothetical protein OJAV_G00192910 [Oryzias javanicus]
MTVHPPHFSTAALQFKDQTSAQIRRSCASHESYAQTSGGHGAQNLDRRNQDFQGKVSVGEVWSCHHGGAPSWMIFVQRGGCRAVLSETPARPAGGPPGEIFLDEKRRFYGPRERKMGLLAFLRIGVWFNGLRAFRKGFLGNVLGEGFVLGGVFVIGRNQQGILLEHREMEFGDKVKISDVLHAVRRVTREL